MCDECPTPGQCKDTAETTTTLHVDKESADRQFEEMSTDALIRIRATVQCPQHMDHEMNVAMGIEGWQPGQPLDDQVFVVLVKTAGEQFVDQMNRVISAHLPSKSDMLRDLRSMFTEMVDEAEARAKAEQGDTPSDQAKDEAVVGTGQTV